MNDSIFAHLVPGHEGHEVESEGVGPHDGVVLTPPSVHHLGHVEAKYEAEWYEVCRSAHVDTEMLEC